MSGKCLYTGNLSPFGQQHTLAKPFKVSVLEVAREYKLSHPQLVPGVGVSVFAADGGVAALGRLTKVSRHKDIQKNGNRSRRGWTVLQGKARPTYPGTGSKGVFTFKKRRRMGEKLENHRKVLSACEGHGAPAATQPPNASPAGPAPAPAPAPSTTPSQEGAPAPSTTPAGPAPAPSTTPSQPSATRSVEFLPDSSAVRPSLPPSAQPPSASKSLYKSQRHAYDRIAVYMIV